MSSHVEPLETKALASHFNIFLLNSVDFLAHSFRACETKLEHLHTRIQHLEAALVLVEKKLGNEEQFQF